MGDFRREFTVSMDRMNRLMTGIVVLSTGLSIVGLALAGSWALGAGFGVKTWVAFARTSHGVTAPWPSGIVLARSSS